MNPEEEFDDADISQEVGAAMRDLPKPVQDFLKSDERDAVVRELSEKYQLHIDQAGEFERSFILMLLGVMRPEEFVTTLTQAGLTQDVVNGLAADLNTRVFMRLRDAERNTPSSAPNAPQKPAPLPPPALDYQPAAAPTLPGSPIAAPMPTPPPAPLEPTMLEVSPVSQHIIPQQHFVHPMPGAQAQSGWHPAAAVHIFVPTHGAQHPQNAPLQQPPEVTPTYVHAPEPAAPVSAAPMERQSQSLPPPAIPTPVVPVIKKEFGSDPYREPIQ